MSSILRKTAIIIIILIAIALGVYLFQKNQNTEEEIVTPANFSFSVASTTLSLLKNENSIQTLSLSEEGLATYDFLQGTADAFITNLDVNFDGHADVGALVSTGYGGVNNYYDFYIFNPIAERLEKNIELEAISNPEVDVEKKQVKSSFRSGPQWYVEVFQFDGTSFTSISSGSVN